MSSNYKQDMIPEQAEWKELPSIGQRMETWFSDREDTLSVVLGVRRYTGRYTNLFTHIIRLTAPKTKRGWMEMSWDANFGGWIYPATDDSYASGWAQHRALGIQIDGTL